jgi:hypothetical protein
MRSTLHQKEKKKENRKQMLIAFPHNHANFPLGKSVRTPAPLTLYFLL